MVLNALVVAMEGIICFLCSKIAGEEDCCRCVLNSAGKGGKLEKNATATGAEPVTKSKQGPG